MAMIDSLQHFHFLRPWWWLALLPWLFLCWRFYLRKLKQGAWQTVIDPEFKSVLLSDQQASKPVQWPIFALALFGILTLFSLAGPTWQEVKLPAEKNRQASVIVLDLSLSMLADDIKPSRLTRVRYKLHDFLKAHPEIPIGMVGYAGSAHTITPISEDNAPLLNLLPTLSPILMPAFGSSPLAAMQQAESLFKGAHIQNKHLIWITDDLEKEQIAELQAFWQQHPMQVSILMVGSETGGPVALPDQQLLKDDQGQIVLPKLPKARLQQFAQSIHADITELSVQDDDLGRLLPRFQAASLNEDEKLKDYAAWLDEGAWLLWGLILLVALSYRRGWLFSWALIGVISLPMVSYSPQSWAQKAEDQENNTQLLDVFKTPDQQGYEHWRKGDFAGAEDRFESPAWKGASFYRMGDYAQAAKAFALDDTARGKYNLGNALAQLGKFKEAKAAYEAVLKINPNLAAAQQNLALINQLLEQPKEQKQEGKPDGQQQKSAAGTQKSEQKPNASEPNSAAQSDLKNESMPSKTSEKASAPANPSDATQAKNQNQSDNEGETGTKAQSSHDAGEGNPQADEHNAAQNKANADAASATADSEQVLAEQNPPQTEDNHAASKLSEASNESPQAATLTPQQQEAEQAKQAWLQQIPDEPGLFLKRKFDYQYQMQEQPTVPTKSW